METKDFRNLGKNLSVFGKISDENFDIANNLIETTQNDYLIISNINEMLTHKDTTEELANSLICLLNYVTDITNGDDPKYYMKIVDTYFIYYNKFK